MAVMKITEQEIARIHYEQRWQSMFDSRPWSQLSKSEREQTWGPHARHWKRTYLAIVALAKERKKHLDKPVNRITD